MVERTSTSWYVKRGVAENHDRIFLLQSVVVCNNRILIQDVAD